MSEIRIGNVTIPDNIFLAPMAGVTDLPFRILCHEQGCAMAYTEMVSAKAIYYGNKNTDALLRTDEREGMTAVQLFGSEPELMAEMALRLEEYPFALIDINMGCPVPKVVNNHEGSALMKDPKLAGAIVRAMADRLHKPVTVKIRKGFFAGEETAPEFAKVLEDNGAAAIAVHGRTREQYYSGKADWQTIARVKRAVSIPVIGNGDIMCADDGIRMLEETGCDGIMVARGARGNPWLFREMDCRRRTGECSPRPSREEFCREILRHAQMLCEQKGEYTGMREMRKHVAWYTAGLPGSAAIRSRVNELERMEQLEELLEKSRYFNTRVDKLDALG